jgi:hypothetical protein
VSEESAAWSDPNQALVLLAERLREAEAPLSDHVTDSEERPVFGLLAALGPRSAGAPAEYAFVVEAVREGYLLHYGEPRLLAGHDEDLALLAGDYLYALGIDRLAVLGDTEAVAVLGDLIGNCAQLHSEERLDEVAGLWRSAALAVGGRDHGNRPAA